MRTRLPLLYPSAVLGLLMVSGAASGAIAGFGDFSGFQINIGDGGAAPMVTVAPGIASSINLINGGGERRSIFCNTKQSISAFTASFTFSGQGGNPCGTCLVIQNSASGTSALGFTDSYSGIASSIAVPLELDNVGNTETGLYTNGITGGSTSSTPVNLFSGHPINVSLSYNGSLLNESLLDTVTSASYSTAYVVNVPSAVGGSMAWIGFTSSSNFGSTQTISNFQFTSSPVPEPTAFGLISIVMSGVLNGRHRIRPRISA